MAIAFLADMHGNIEALEACLRHVRSSGINRLVFLGDYVGYGADPEAVTQRIMAAVAAGAIAVKGNHDAAIVDQRIGMNDLARQAIDWTRARLSDASNQFLAALPLTATEDSRLYVHAEASNPSEWNYVLTSEDAALSLAATEMPLTFCGHVHEPAIYSCSMVGKLTRFVPVTDVAIPLMPQRRWLIVLGSVGQPRDGIAAASLAIFDEERNELTFRRVPYDVETAAQKILAAGLPPPFAERLKHGR
jgi:diadenosine tetraphosphatase ApaH/serine/threonine PP2A family protein phosphatase